MIIKICRNCVLIAAVAILLSACSGASQQPTANAVQATQVAIALQGSATTSALTPAGGLPFGSVVGTPAPALSTGSPMPSPTMAALPGDNRPSPTFGSIVEQITSPPTDTQIPATPLPVPTLSGPQPTFGSVIGPGYTEPPTFTPVPAATLPPPGTLLPAPTAGPTPTPGPVLRADLMGIQVNGNLTDQDWAQVLNHAQDLGVGWIKIQLSWAQYEPTRGNFSTDYHGLILNIQRASLRGFRMMINIDKAPGWARPPGVVNQEDGPPDNPQDLADFVQRFVTDCKPEFIDAIEVWNEPNLIREWRGKPISGAEYMKYFNAAYQAVITAEKAQPSALRPNHRIMVVTAGPAPTSTTANGNTENDRDWLQQLYVSGLAQTSSDVAVGVHPYGWANSPDWTCCAAHPGITGWFEDPSFYFRNTIDDYRKIMLRNNHTAGKLWITEFGWATYDGLTRSNGSPASPAKGVEWEGMLNQAQQAQYDLEAFRVAQKSPYYDFLGPMMLWNLNFANISAMTDQSREEAGFSLLNNLGNPRPVYDAIKSAAKQDPAKQP